MKNNKTTNDDKKMGIIGLVMMALPTLVLLLSALRQGNIDGLFTLFGIVVWFLGAIISAAVVLDASER